MKDPFVEFADALRGWVPDRLDACGHCPDLVGELRGLSLEVDTLEEIVAELARVEPSIRAALAHVKEHDPELARGLSKLADVPACADFLTPEEMLGKLEFLRERL